MIYVHLYQTVDEFNSAYTGENYLEPWVSCTMESSGVAFNKGTAPSHDYVEIGGVKWATMNLGATAVTDCGKYYAWGETTGYYTSQVGTDKDFTWSDYELCYGTGSVMKKYNSRDGLTTLESVDDAVTAEWGDGWKMPTTVEWQALGAAVNAAWTSDYQGSGVAGLVCTDKTDSSKVLFFPTAGYCGEGSIYRVDSGTYWSSTVNNDYLDFAAGRTLYFTNENTYWANSNSRYYGCSVRGVLDE